MLPVCPKPNCDNTSFKAVKANIKDVNFQYLFICCDQCGTIVGTTEQNYTPEVVQRLANKLKLGPLG